MEPNRAVEDGRSDDLLILSAWVKKDLFNQVKFLYELDEDLAVNGQIYNKFLLECKDRLVGLKIRERETSEYRRRYCESLWNHATRKKGNLVTRGLNARRSSIYSGTQNRFHGKFAYPTNEPINICLTNSSCPSQIYVTNALQRM